MKQLPLTPPLLLITMGYPGAGKSYFSRQFSELYGLACLSEDRLRYELFEQPLFNSDEQEILNRVFSYALSQQLLSGKNIVVDGNFSTFKRRKELKLMAEKNGFKTLIVWLQTDMATALQRATHRDRRNLDSKYSFNLDKSVFERLSSRLQRPRDNEETVVISGKHAFKGQHVTVLRKIADMYAQAALKSTSTPVRRDNAILMRPKPGQHVIR